MTNYELHKEEIEKLILENGHLNFGIADNKFIICGEDTVSCEKCIFYGTGNCVAMVIKWLNQEPNDYAIPSDTPIDTKVLVSDDGDTWYRQYFFHFSSDNDAPYICFANGTTYWSAIETKNWKYCKLLGEACDDDYDYDYIRDRTF